MDPSPWTLRLLMLGTRPLAPHPEGSPASQGLHAGAGVPGLLGSASWDGAPTASLSQAGGWPLSWLCCIPWETVRLYE